MNMLIRVYKNLPLTVGTKVLLWHRSQRSCLSTWYLVLVSKAGSMCHLDPSISHSGIYPKKIVKDGQNDWCLRKFILTFYNSKNWKQFKCPKVGDWIISYNSYRVEYYQILKMWYLEIIMKNVQNLKSRKHHRVNSDCKHTLYACVACILQKSSLKGYVKVLTVIISDKWMRL